MNQQMTRGSVAAQKSRVTWGLVASAAACLMIAAAAGFAGMPDTKPSPAVLSLRETGKAFAEVTRKAAPAVVFVSVEKSQPSLTGFQPA